jgi:hypothetical protein
MEQIPQEDIVMEVLQQEINFHTQHTLITYFVGTKIPPHRIVDWVVLLNAIIKFGVINFRMDARRGFLYLSTTITKSTMKLLMLTPHKTPWGATVYVQRVLMFNPKLSQGLKIFVWCSLNMFPLEY